MAVKVKKLEWEPGPPGLGVLRTIVADSVVGRYSVTPENGGAYLNGRLVVSALRGPAAAQDDFNRRILSSIEQE